VLIVIIATATLCARFTVLSQVDNDGDASLLLRVPALPGAAHMRATAASRVELIFATAIVLTVTVSMAAKGLTHSAWTAARICYFVLTATR
jgi:hypothetical protein